MESRVIRVLNLSLLKSIGQSFECSVVLHREYNCIQSEDMEGTQTRRGASSYATRLDRTLRVMQDRVKEQEAILEKISATSDPAIQWPSQDPKSHLRQLRALKSAYESLASSEPWLVPVESPLPALLALRKTDSCIQETKASIVTTEEKLKRTNQRLEKEKADLSDAKLIQTSLHSRMSVLREGIENHTEKSPGQIAKDTILGIKRKNTHFDGQTGKLINSFNQFIDDHLAAMLAAEELGGPIVGDVINVDEEMLEGGLSAKGKSQRPKARMDEDQRQRRIDQIWGARPSESAIVDKSWNEKEAAAAEMRELTEELLNCLAEVDGIRPGTYVNLQRESAAARFLVRSKVAVFHPKDARKLRLVDFGGEIDD